MGCKVCGEKISGKRRVFCSEKCSKRSDNISWKTRNRVVYLEGKKKYREKNKERDRLYHVERKRLYRLANRGFLSGKEKRRMLTIGSCFRCSSQERLNVHHIKPVVFGGKSDKGNLMILCFSCHMLWHKLLKGFWLEESR